MSRLGKPMDDYLRIHRAREDGPVVLQAFAQLRGIGKVAVMRKRNVSAPETSQHRLGIPDGRGACGAVAGVTDCDCAGELLQFRVRETLGHQPHGAQGSRSRFLVYRNNAGALLPPVLKRVEPQMHDCCSIRMPANAEYSTHV